MSVPFLGRTDGGLDSRQLRLADILDLMLTEPPPFRVTTYDGSTTGPADAWLSVHLATPRGAAYLATAPGSLGMARLHRRRPRGDRHRARRSLRDAQAARPGAVAAPGHPDTGPRRAGARHPAP